LSIFAKFHEIPQKYQNSAEKGKFCGLAQNSVTCRKLWALANAKQKKQNVVAIGLAIF